MLRNAKSLEGYELAARDGAIGRVKDIYFDDAEWRVRYFVVDTGSWLTDRSVLISAAALTLRDWDSQRLQTELTREQVRNSPSIDTAKPFSRQHEQDLHAHYGWPFYWGGPMSAPMFGTAYVGPVTGAAAPSALAAHNAGDPNRPTPGTYGGEVQSERDREPREAGDPHLRSLNEVRGYHIDALDGAIGHVEDLVLEDTDWSLRYLMIDTRNWLPGKKVIIPLRGVRSIEWAERSVHVELTRDAIKAGPEFEEQRPFAGDYVDRLETHYRGGRQAKR